MYSSKPRKKNPGFGNSYKFPLSILDGLIGIDKIVHTKFREISIKLPPTKK
jgi:hypothetical protein